MFHADRFLQTLSRLISLGPRLQNAPAAGLVPQEHLAAEVVLERLQPALLAGAVQVNTVAAPGQQDRPSLVFTVPGRGDGAIGLVGAHFDVVPADPEHEDWQSDPFRLSIGADGTLRGRGVSDCLGHVALLTELLVELHDRRLSPEKTLRVIMIANEEESALPGIGMEAVLQAGFLDLLRDQTIYWLDSGDFGPTLGTGGIARWAIEAEGVAGHSGLPNHCVNALELAFAAARGLAEWFERTYPAHPEELRYNYASPSSLKATVVHCDNDKITKIPGNARVEGDLRMTPFYDLAKAVRDAERWVQALNQRLAEGERVSGFPPTVTEDGNTGRVRFEPIGPAVPGIACRLNSPGLAELNEALRAVLGPEGCRPWSMTGSLPLVSALQERGFDVQITGFGQSKTFHAPDEQGQLSDFEAGFGVLWRLIRPG